MDERFSEIAEAYSSIGKFVKPTVDWIKFKFVRFNPEMFGGKLAIVPFAAKKMHLFEMGGCAVCTNDGKSIVVPELSLNSLYFTNERTLEDVLIHEMIHLENAQLFPEQLIVGGEIRGELQHTTECFVSEMNRINKTYGRCVKIKVDVHDGNFKISKEYRDSKSNTMKNITFYCVRSGGVINVFMVNDVVQKKLRDEIFAKYGSDNIETVKPKNVYDILEKRFAMTSTAPTTSFDDEASFENFKREATTLIESNTQNVEMPDWAKKSLAKGNDVQFMHGRWVIVLH